MVYQYGDVKQTKADIIRSVALKEAIIDCKQDNSIRNSIVADWIDAKTTEEQLQVISDEEEVQAKVLGFNPSIFKSNCKKNMSKRPIIIRHIAFCLWMLCSPLTVGFLIKRSMEVWNLMLTNNSVNIAKLNDINEGIIIFNVIAFIVTTIVIAIAFYGSNDQNLNNHERN